MDYDPQVIEERWRERWASEGRYEAEPTADDGAIEKTFVTVPYPYPSGGMHIGHARTYTVPDVYARYRRQRGDAVLFPIAWHVTGTPIVGAVERLRNGEQRQIDSLQNAFGVPEADLRELETPMGYARYFIEEAASSYKRGMRRLGLSIDWRREFTTNDERYSRFVTWQYETLRERRLLEKGKHPVKYCTREENPVTTHDLLEGEEAEFQEYTLIRFEWERDDDVVIAPMATLRPETVRGVTNVYVDPAAEYVLATVDRESWLISEPAVEKLRLQQRSVEVVERFAGERVVGERVRNPVTDEAVLVFPAGFVDADNATGVVMSVPAHSPDDYVALREVQADAERLARAYGLEEASIRAIEPIPILTVEGYGTVPARTAVEDAGIDSSDDPRLDEVTTALYRDEFNDGRLTEAYGPFAGDVVRDARSSFRERHRDRGHFDTFYEFTEEVICRCGGAVAVAYQDTWFLRYDDPGWKEKAHRAVARLDAIPENTREQYADTIEWLNGWPCIRNYGLGTRLPWDPTFVIEPLSDSTIYMAYYAIAHRLEDVPVEELDREFFDTLFSGPEAVDDPNETAIALREEWEFWYPVDVRCSGNDLIRNHLTFFLYHHAELFEEPHWPRGITVMGMGLLEGRRMSSSKGHVVLPGDAIDRYGADTVRFFLLNAAEPWQDYDWQAEEVGTTRDQLERFWHHAQTIIEADRSRSSSELPSTEPDGGRSQLERIDRWLLANLQDTIREVTDALERFETRTASQVVFYRFEERLRWYRRRTDLDRPGAQSTLRAVLETRLRLLAPLIPFVTNELHEQLTGLPADDAPWPDPDHALEAPQVSAEERLVSALYDDIAEVASVTGTDPSTVRIYVAEGWKRQVLRAVVEQASGTDGVPQVGTVMASVMENDALRERGEEVNTVVARLIETVRDRGAGEVEHLDEIDELDVYDDASAFLSREFDAEVVCVPETETDDEKATDAIPLRPAIRLE